MSDLHLRGDVRTAFSHLTLIGLAAILEEAGAAGVRIGWTTSLDPRPVVSTLDIAASEIGEAVGAHAALHSIDGNWVAQGLMSPRITPPKDQAAWERLDEERSTVIDRQLDEGRSLDLRLIGALGEPAYWRFDRRGQRRGQRRPDEGASRWEMKTRNRGETFVADRLRKLAEAVAAREPSSVIDGLAGEQTIDEAGHDAIDSRTATGLAAPGPTDNAVAWCALWGISQFPVVHLVTAQSRTAGHIEGTRGSGMRHGWFCIPVPDAPMALPRLRTINASAQLAWAGAPCVSEARSSADALRDEAARAWLTDHGVGAIVRFPIAEFGSANAPERRALAGKVMPLDRDPCVS